LIKRFFVNHEVKVNEDEEELIGDETDILKVVKVKDDGNNKINVEYSYTYEIEGDIFEDRVEVELTFGLGGNNTLLVHFERIDGNILYYKKVVNDLKSRFVVA